MKRFAPHWTAPRLNVNCRKLQLLLGDLNAKLGKELDGEIDDKFELVTRNEDGEKWVQ